MEDEDKSLADLMIDVTCDVPNRTGDGPDARDAFFRQFLALAREAVGDFGQGSSYATSLSGGTQPRQSRFGLTRRKGLAPNCARRAEHSSGTPRYASMCS